MYKMGWNWCFHQSGKDNRISKAGKIRVKCQNFANQTFGSGKRYSIGKRKLLPFFPQRPVELPCFFPYWKINRNHRWMCPDSIRSDGFRNPSFLNFAMISATQTPVVKNSCPFSKSTLTCRPFSVPRKYSIHAEESTTYLPFKVEFLPFVEWLQWFCSPKPIFLYLWILVSIGSPSRICSISANSLGILSMRDPPTFLVCWMRTAYNPPLWIIISKVISKHSG